MTTVTKEARSVAQIVRPIAADSDYELLVRLAGNHRIVLIGEASHGTHEFYEIRAQLTKRLIEGNGFRLLAVEADWPDALRVHRYVQGSGDDKDGNAGLGD